MNTLKMPRLLSDGMVLQQKKKIHIWGFHAAGKKVLVSFLGEEAEAITGEDGKWELWLSEKQAGGPYVMQVSDDTTRITITDVWVGDVWMCSGQSNMELPIARVKDRFLEEVKTCENPAVRTFKIVEHADFNGPLTEHLTGEWKSAKEETIMDFSATAYFFARQMYELTKVPIGLINASLGGSRTESWMSREMLEGYDEELALAEQYADDAFVQNILKRNMQQADTWHAELDAKDLGTKENWQSEETCLSDWKEIEVPCFFRDTALKGFIGCVWFRRTFHVSSTMAGQAAKVWMGTIVDSDVIYINGVQVGRTEYQYPPRKYEIPQGLLKEGENTIVIRIKCDNGEGRITKGKEHMVWNEQEKIDLDGTWLYRIGAACERVQPTDFVNWKPTGLYNGMTAPCHAYTIAGILWYQGEANASVEGSAVHVDLMSRLIGGYRKNWKDESLPFFYVQLPNFQMNVFYGSDGELDSAWPAFREAQRNALAIPDTGMVVAIDLGEDNDLHPLNKKAVGTRLAMLAANRMYGYETECDGPQIKAVTECRQTESDGAEQKTDYSVTLLCEGCKGGLLARSRDKGEEIKDFILADQDGETYQAQAVLDNNQIVLTGSGLKAPLAEIRYCYDFTNNGALIYNQDGFPMSPFVMKI